MLTQRLLFAAAFLTFAHAAPAEEANDTTRSEPDVLAAMVGIWDAKIEVWPQGVDQPSMEFNAIETIRSFGNHWLASDLDTDMEGTIMTVHSIAGYDLDAEQLVYWSTDFNCLD
jgi:hypothetical protein